MMNDATRDGRPIGRDAGRALALEEKTDATRSDETAAHAWKRKPPRYHDDRNITS